MISFLTGFVFFTTSAFLPLCLPWSATVLICLRTPVPAVPTPLVLQRRFLAAGSGHVLSGMFARVPSSHSIALCLPIPAFTASCSPVDSLPSAHSFFRMALIQIIGHIHVHRVLHPGMARVGRKASCWSHTDRFAAS